MPPITAAQLDALIAGYPAASNWPAQADAALIECRVQLFGPVTVPPPPGAEAPPTMDIGTFRKLQFPMTWPDGRARDLESTGPIGAQDVLVLSFVTPSLSASDGRTKQMSPISKGAFSFPCMRLLTLATQPQIGGGIKMAYGQGPALLLKVGGTKTGPNDLTCYLQPSTTYYVTIVNRRPPANDVSIAPPNTGEMKIHFNN